MNKTIKKVICLSLLTLTMTGCGNVPKLKDGTELIVEMDGLKMTTEEFYQKLKDTYGTYSLINSIDDLLLNNVYKTTDEMKEKIEKQILTLKNQFGSDFESAIQYYYGVSTEKQLYNLLEIVYKRELATSDYADTLVKDEDIKKYYDEEAIGDIKASHILIKSDATDSMTDDEKKESKEKALNTAKEVIEKLDNGEKFEDLAKEYSKDSSASDGGDLGYFNKGDMVSGFEEAAIKLKVNEYTKEPVETQFGYHIILKTDQKEKGTLEETKDKIKTTLKNNLIKNTSNISVFALEWLREKYDLKIYDAELKIKYDHYMNEQKSSKTTES